MHVARRLESTSTAPHTRAPSRDVRLDWPGRRFHPGQLDSAGDTSPVSPANTRVDEVGSDATIFFGDALHTATHLARHEGRGRAHLVYLDPPYASQADYAFEARLDGSASGRARRGVAYGDRWGEIGAYLEEMGPRLEAMATLLHPEGSLWIHLDWRAAYLVRVLVEEILGRDSFLNEIVWRRAPNLGRQAASAQFGRTLDTILVFGGPEAKIDPPTRLEKIDPGAVRIDEQGRPFTTAPRGDYTDASIERLEREGRVHRTKSGKVYIKYFLQTIDGEHYRERRVDTLWTDVAPLRHAAKSERTGYPTQKPLSLLERIVRCATPEGGTVVDLFAGSGSTAEAALRLGRNVWTGDRGAVSIATTRARLLRSGYSPSVVHVGSPCAAPRGDAIRATCRHAGDLTEITLESPDLPLAWAVDGAIEGPFHRVFHAERTNAGPATIERTASIPRASKVRVRVWTDDGTMHETLAFE